MTRIKKNTSNKLIKKRINYFFIVFLLVCTYLLYEIVNLTIFKNEEYNGEVIPFSTTPQKTKKGFVSKIKGVFDDERKQLKKLDKIAQEIISL